MAIHAFVSYLNANLNSKKEVNTFREFQKWYLFPLGDTVEVEIITISLKCIWDELMINEDTSKSLNRLMEDGKPKLNDFFGEQYRKFIWNEFSDSIGGCDPVEHKEYE